MWSPDLEMLDLKAGQADDAAVAVYYSRRLLDEPKPPQEDQQEQGKTEQLASLPTQAAETKFILPPYAAHTNSSDTVAALIPEVSYRDLTPKVTVIDLVDGQRWAAPQAQPLQERIEAPQDGQTEASLSSEVVHRDLGEGHRWVAPQTQLRHRRGDLRGRREGVVLQPSVPSPSQGKEAPRGGRGCLCGPCLVVSLLQCAQAMTFTLLVYHVYLEWF
ncbi:hypothetical protein E2C01_025903 [Portunus trituberculatus]|uniref:Uncharacterized protein n=1 Tax=Portunus trituberculatus TaxID=210409 RepID=A0A5B7EHE2_PORTR|nr:hypothetical protein [Portunus trituberculatus]